MTFQTERTIERMITEDGQIDITIVDQETGESEDILLVNDNWEFVKSEIEGYENGYDVYL
jgi:hypothetical protein